MELLNEFKVDSPVEKVWEVLTDVERIAPCMPGAQLDEVDGDEFRGHVKVKVGPISAEYRGSATFLERDTAAYRAVLRAEGRETRGQGKASATITAALAPQGESTAVTVKTDLAITGKVAQFGRGVLADVSAKLLGEFVKSLETTVLSSDSPSTMDGSQDASDAGSPDGGASATRSPAPPPLSSGAGTPADADAAAIDLFKVAGPILLKRVVLPGLGLVALWALSRMVRRRRRRREGRGGTTV